MRDGVGQHYVESGYAIGRDYQQLVFDCVNISYLAAPKKFDTGNTSLNNRVNSLASSSRVNLSNRVELSK
jgi:hypothetical protein